MCIHQEDKALQKEGIDAISTFLYRSSHMVILYDKDYFTRLWHAASQAERVACELVSCQRIVIPFHDCAVRGDLEYRKRLL